VEAIDLAVDGAPVASHVNLVLQAGAVLGTEVLSFGPIAPDAKLEDGRPGVRLPIPRDSGASRVLREVVLFFPAAGAQPPARNPVTEISFVGRRYGTGTQTVAQPLPKQVGIVSPGRERVMVPLDSLTTGNDAALVQALLVIVPPDAPHRCGLRLDPARLVNTYRQGR
jgi:hypothetical protein